MKRFRLSPKAQRDIEQIWWYIARDNRDLATRVRLAIRDACRRLASFPHSGQLRDDLSSREDVRFWPVFSYLIVYRPNSRPLQIVRVLHGNRDVAQILED